MGKSAKHNKKSSANPAVLDPYGTKGQIQVVIETPRGSRNKYAFDHDLRAFKLKKVLPEGMAFPHDFGFIPSTQADDGDPIDVLVLMDQTAFPGCIIECRLIGVIEGEQSQKRKKPERNDRLIAVSNTSHTHSNIHSIGDLNKTMLDEVEKFFVNYHESDGAKFKVIGRGGPNAATKLLKHSERKAA